MPDSLQNVFGADQNTFTPYRDEDSLAYNDPASAGHLVRQMIQSSDFNRIVDVTNALEVLTLSMVRGSRGLQVVYGTCLVTVTPDGGTFSSTPPISPGSTDVFNTGPLTPASFSFPTAGSALFSTTPFAASHFNGAGTLIPHFIYVTARFQGVIGSEVQTPTGSSTGIIAPVVPLINCLVNIVPSNTIQVKMVNHHGRIPAGNYILSAVVFSVDTAEDVAIVTYESSHIILVGPANLDYSSSSNSQYLVL